MRDIDPKLLETRLHATLMNLREYLDKGISRDQLEELIASSESHPLDILDDLYQFAEIIGASTRCNVCGLFHCDPTEDH